MAQAWQSSLSSSLFAAVHDGGALAPAIAQKIGDAILMGVVADGEQLPSEADLATQLAISTVTLRAALAILRQEGLVETRRGRHGGSFICVPRSYSPERSLQQLAAMSPSQIRELGDENMAVAGVAAMRAARRFDDDNIHRLVELAAQLAEAELVGQRVRLDSRFHIEIAVTSQSERLTHRMVALQSEYIGLLWLPESSIDPHVCADQHRALVDAISAGESGLARELAEAHALENTHHLVELRVRMVT